MHGVAIVAALEREIQPLVRHWRVSGRQHAGRVFRFFEDGNTVVVCAGIGAEAARRAAEAVIVLYSPAVIYSAGFAGALEPRSKVADILVPARVINASDGCSIEIRAGKGVLVSFDAIASREQKARLAESFGAQAVDMEAVAVSRAAQARGVRFAAVKAISDEWTFSFPPIDRFVSPTGSFSVWKFVGFVSVRPWLWSKVLRLARNSALASRSLSNWLQEMLRKQMLEPTRQEPALPLETSYER